MDHRQRDVVVETVALTKNFKDFWGRDKVRAVDDLNLQIHQGEVFGLLGPNGSGKKTTIKMLLGLLYPSRGRARLFGKDPSDVSAKSRIGYLPEETRLYQFLDSVETLDFYGRLFKLDGSERDRRTDALVEMVGLSAAATRPVGQYSKGMARRIGLAQSLINDPDFLILDEPTSGMDPIGTRSIKDLILELKTRGKTILLSSHLLSDVEDVCDRVAIMYGGKLLCCGPVSELLAQQEMTQVVTERLSGEQVRELTAYMAETLGTNVVSVGTPRDRLEQFFLRIVRQAQEEMQLKTSGALAGGQVSEFLRARGDEPIEGAALLDQLSSVEEPRAAEGSAVKEIRREPVRTDVLEQLAQGREPESREAEGDSVKEVHPEKAEVDRSVLDGLVDGSGGQEGGVEKGNR